VLVAHGERLGGGEQGAGAAARRGESGNCLMQKVRIASLAQEHKLSGRGGRPWIWRQPDSGCLDRAREGPP
jgi:hypothetical protein